MNTTKRNKGGPKLVFPPILVVNWVSSPLSFFMSAFTAATYIFTAPTCTTTIIILKPCALNVEFQHFILRFNKISLLCRYHWKRRQGMKERVTLWITLIPGPKLVWKFLKGFTTRSRLVWFFLKSTQYQLQAVMFQSEY